MKKVFITGGAGYVGAVMVPHLLEQGFEVTVLDLMIYGEHVLPKHANLNAVKGDIRDQDLLRNLIPGHDAVIHLACISNDPSFEMNPELGKSINLDAFRPLVEISKKFGIKRFFYASSSSVYGIKDEPNVHEEMELEPLTDYSIFKADCEKILAEYQSDDFTTTTIRPATVCGYSPRQRLDVVVNILTNLAYHKREISIFGGDQLRPNIHIKDMVEAYRVLLEAEDSVIQGEIFNCGYQNMSIADIAALVAEIVPKYRPEIGEMSIETSPSNDLRSYHVNSEKITRVLGFTPKYSVANAIEDLCQAFSEELLPESFTDTHYFNVQRMKELNVR